MQEGIKRRWDTGDGNNGKGGNSEKMRRVGPEIGNINVKIHIRSDF